MIELDKLIEKAEQIRADKKLTEQRKNVLLSDVMTDMEREFEIPAMSDQKFEAEHPDLIKAYRKISNMREF